MEKAQIQKLVAENGVEFLILQFVCVLGELKHLELPVGQLDKVLNGEVMFDGSSISGFAKIENSDMYLKPDLSSFVILPWSDGAEARLLCDIYLPDGTPFEGDPRSVLKRALEKAESLGYNGLNVGPEPEFFLFPLNDKGQPVFTENDGVGYFEMRAQDKAQKVRQAITRTLQKMGFDVEALHHEVALGQSEVNFKYSNALKTADDIVTFKWVVKEVAQQHGFFATFMPKPVARINGSGMHVNQSLFTEGGNAFYDAADTLQLSDDARHYIAGILAHAKAFAAVTNPTVNSYKRLVPGYEAPCYIAWSCSNRSALVRIPATRKAGTRIEVRCPDPMANPYLAIALMLVAGLDGIENKIQLPGEVKENIYHMTDATRSEYGIEALPADLNEALQHLAADEVLKNALGKHLYNAYIELKKAEWDEYRLEVHAWELKKYS